MSHDDFAFEPVRGLPARLPPGENLLWQGSPDWKVLAVRAFHVRKAAVYFALLMVWRLTSVEAHGALALLTSIAWLATLGTVLIAILCGLAYASARSAVYSITSARVILRHGIAVSTTMNVPFALIDAANVKVFGAGVGDIVLTLPRGQRIGFLVTWPHVQPGRILQPRPALRSIPDVQAAANVLGDALRQFASTENRVVAAPTAASAGATTPGATAPEHSASIRPLPGQPVAA